ncbi:adenosylmethionine--8-amino-7-oxononanoate transaminase [Legionella sp. PATHC032]|uniref:adenosylmethionine--8-amino-7-oxononanoate transaminase n=1 Tax=Legionella sp. PATHC032 TaxID=2992039 RepID=UPI001B2B155E|nr:adenosylmethionine--8-amino-7-oxononanoate transaminase [Legionella sp. PATHC032]MCW8421352.1 adenosylmethionine--8-amino-7-oxononanoate transaminase [Legionella sp. PATHC032]HAZ7573187.1 adenosylmethionine--8-amino-7-oxononanoate transaminase [Legionella pneumophila]HBA1635640.1 adenosylmethionine--8-amino-7-oxononanoate transaminase [Legionella pneumophila]
MVNIDQLIAKDLKHIWHPCSQMKDFETCPPIIVNKAQGSYLYTNKGPLIDAISSWWCKSLGHGHPAVIAAIKNQLDYFEHVISANTTHPAAVELAEKLSEITGKQHVFFASDGSSAVEIAMKLAIHASQIKGNKNKNQFIALKNGYHGETIGTMSVSDLGLYKAPYASFGVQCHFIDDIPYVSGTKDPLWKNCDTYWNKVVQQLNKICERVCAVLLEPIIQGAGGMLCYSADFLAKISLWAKEKGIYLIADEIMTGIGRTGKWLACDHAHIKPDLICLSKGLTSGSIPFSCVMIDSSLFDLFYDDYHAGKSFLHSHTYSGNPLAISAALATIKTIDQDNLLMHSQELGEIMFSYLQDIAKDSRKLVNVRGVGAVVAADLIEIESNQTRIGFKIYQEAIKQGALLRPIGNTLYWLPPLNTDKKIIGKLAEITLNSIEEAYNKAQGYE